MYLQRYVWYDWSKQLSLWYRKCVISCYWWLTVYQLRCTDPHFSNLNDVLNSFKILVYIMFIIKWCTNIRQVIDYFIILCGIVIYNKQYVFGLLSLFLALSSPNPQNFLIIKWWLFGPLIRIGSGCQGHQATFPWTPCGLVVGCLLV